MRRRGQKAQALIEMALLTPMLFMLLVFVFDLARAAYTWAAISEAVREGSRTSITIGTTTQPGVKDTDILGAVQLFGVNMVLNPVAGCYHGYSSGTATPAPAAGNTGYIYLVAPTAGQPNAPQGQSAVSPAETVSAGCNAVNIAPLGTYPLKVVVAYNFQPFTPFAQQFMPGGITMIASSTMNTEF
jgi:Flp pilus assembly protein TadG